MPCPCAYWVNLLCRAILESVPVMSMNEADKIRTSAVCRRLTDVPSFDSFAGPKSPITWQPGVHSQGLGNLTSSEAAGCVPRLSLAGVPTV